MPFKNPDAVVSTDWLAKHLDAPDVRIVDGSYHLPGAGRDARAEFAAKHIPGAVFFDIDDICDDKNPLPHMIPSPEKFSSKVRKLGLGDGVRIVIYDVYGMMSAARVWWMFRLFGHNDVAILDGGLPKWEAEGRALSDDPVTPRERHFTARFDTTQVRSVDQMQQNLETARAVVLDARAKGRFEGTEPEIRPGLASGHIPGSLSLPFTDLLNPADKTFRTAEELEAAFARAGLPEKGQIITTCGSGVTACVLALGLHLIGRKDVAVYDGSWTEWGGRKDLPVATGPA